jgi:hypothetical protein
VVDRRWVPEGGDGAKAMNDGAAKAAQQAAEDLEDIATLERTAAFSRYFLRRIRAKREDVRVAFENDPPEKCSHDEREIRRRIMKAYDELLGMMAQDRATAGAHGRSN